MESSNLSVEREYLQEKNLLIFIREEYGYSKTSSGDFQWLINKICILLTFNDIF